MNKFIASIQAVKVPESLDLIPDELNAIRAEAAEPFDVISLAFQCGFMRGQENSAVDRMKLAEFATTVQTIHSVALALACALDGITENGCEPNQFVPALYQVECDLKILKDRMEAALDQEGGDA